MSTSGIEDLDSKDIRMLIKSMMSDDEGQLKRALPRFIQQLIDNRDHLTVAYLEAMIEKLKEDRIF